MKPIVGIELLLAIKRAVEWNQALAVGAGEGILYLKGQAKRDATVQTRKTRGTAYSVGGTVGPITCQPSYDFELTYGGMELLAALFMGAAGLPVQQGATAAYLHSFPWTPSTYALFATIVKTMINYIEEVPTGKIASISLSGEVGATPLTLTVGVIGVNKEVASEVNTLETFELVTIDPLQGDPVMFSHLEFRMNDRDGLALDADDRIYPSKFTLTASRKMEGKYTGQYRTAGDSPQDLIDEPVENDQPEIKLTLEFPVHTEATYLADLGNDTRKKLDITAVGPVIEGAYHYQHRFPFPHLQLVTANPSDDNGRIVEPLEFLVHGTLVESAGMAGITVPFIWEMISRMTTDPLG